MNSLGGPLYKRIVMVVAGVLFALLALVAAIVTDLYDRDYPQAIGAESRVGLDFDSAQFTAAEAFATLADLDARWGLGLVKVAPDLAGDPDRQIFVALNDRGLPAEFRYFGGDVVGKVVGKERLAHSYPDGSYLVTGDSTHLGDFVDALSRGGVQVNRSDASVADSLGFVVREGSFAAAVLAAFALIAVLALFWLSVRARSRALRVLGGCPTARIHVQDLGGFLGALSASAVAVAVTAAAGVGVFRGWMYVGSFLKALIGLQIAVIAAALLAALVMSASAWPSATMLATRQPAVKTLRSTAVVIQALMFLLVLTTAGPAWSAYRNSSATAAEMAQWRKLSDQVSVAFATSDDEMTRIEPQIGRLVQEAESLDSVAYSYTFTPESWMADFGDYSAVSFVNQRWLDLMTTEAPPPALAPVPYQQVRGLVVPAFGEQLELWSRGQASGAEQLARLAFLRPVDGFRLPVATGGGGLHFMDDVLVVVVPSLYDTIDDANLASMVSTRNIVFTGVPATQKLLERQGLAPQALRDRGFRGQLRVVYIAEEGMLRAQFAAYVVWLLNLALAALAVAFTVAVAISALITALLRAKRDFPQRVAGQPWTLILRSRVTRELLAGAGLTVIALLLQEPDATGAVLVAAVFGLFVVPLSHLFSVRWCFTGVGRRRI